MFRFSICALVVAGVSSLAAMAEQNAAPVAQNVVVQEMCVVKADKDIRLSAREAGVLVNLTVKDGQEVGALQVIGKIDDSQPQLQKEAAIFGRDAAVERYKTDVEIRYAKAAADVAKAEYDKNVDANRRQPGSIAEIDVERAKLDWNRAKLQIEKATTDQGLARFEALEKATELKGAELGIDRRTVVAPWDGIVVSLLRHQDEWVNPGDPILQLVRLNTMRVDTKIDQSKYDPREIDGCAVTVEVDLAHDKKASFTGHIVYVSPLVDSRGTYVVRAEVANRKDGAGHWLLRDGHKSKMTIHLGTAAAR